MPQFHLVSQFIGGISRRRSILWIAALAVVCTGLFALAAGALVPIPAADGEGPWMNPANVQECSALGGSTICAEWPVYSDGIAVICCIDPNLLGTYQRAPDTCQKSLGIRAL